MKRLVSLVFISLMLKTGIAIPTPSIPMKIKRVVYDFLLTLDQKNIDTSALVCQMVPIDSTDYKGAILNQETDLPEVKLATLFFWNDILYLDDKMIDSIRQQEYTLSAELKYQIVYRLALLKFAREKSRLYPDLFFYLGVGATLLSLGNFEFAIFTYFDRKIQDSRNFAQSGLAHAVFGTLMYGIYFLTRKSLSFLQEQKELQQIRLKAAQLACDTLRIEPLN